MGKVNYYITKNGVLKRKQNTVYFVRKKEDGELEKRILPINKIYAIFAHGRISFTSGVVSYLAKNGIPIHFFNKYGWYEGSFYPRETLISGDLLVKQVEHYLNKQKRLFLAREFIRGCGDNVIKNLQYYSRAGKDLSEEIDKITQLIEKLENQDKIEKVLSVEGSILDVYYSRKN
jgi:CRISPR-associated protein Cas1